MEFVGDDAVAELLDPHQPRLGPLLGGGRAAHPVAVDAAVRAGHLPAQDTALAATALLGALHEALVGPLAPSNLDDPIKLRDAVQTVTLLALRAVGVMDARGFFKIVDRKKDMILVSGFNVYPNELEDVVSKLPGVLECAVVGVPDEKTGEAVKLFVVRAANSDITAEALAAHCRHLLKYLGNFGRIAVIIHRISL